MEADCSGQKAPPSKSVSDKQKGSVLMFAAQPSPSELSPSPCSRVRRDRLLRAGPGPNGPFEIIASPGPAGPAVVLLRKLIE
jgi:hypothetical protein